MEDKFKIKWMGDAVEIIFTNGPSLQAIQEAREFLDKLTDRMIKERLDANSAINPSQE